MATKKAKICGSKIKEQRESILFQVCGKRHEPGLILPFRNVKYKNSSSDEKLRRALDQFTGLGRE